MTTVSPWGFKGTLVGQLSSELATAREALRSGRAEDCARITARLVAEIVTGQVAADDTEDLQRLELIHASALTTLGRAEQVASPPEGLARFEEAVRIFKSAVGAGAELRPDELADYGTALGELGRLEEAEPFVNLALERDAFVPAGVVLAIADLLSRRSEPAEADRLLNLALDAGAEDPAIAERLARSLGEAGQTDKAADTFAQAGMWYGAGGAPGEALRCFGLALGLAPDHIGAMLGRSYALSDLGQREEALATIERTLERHPDSVEACAYTAQLLASLGRPEEALRLLEDRLALSGEIPELRAARARILLSAGRPHEALPAVEKLLAELPTDVELRRLKALILRCLDRREDAVEILSGLLAENEATPADRLVMIDMVIGMGEYERALTETEHALLFVPENPGLLGRRALILAFLARFEEALAAALHAAALDPADPVPLHAQAEALIQLGRVDDALRPVRQLLNLSPDSLATRRDLTELLVDQDQLDEADRLVAEGLRIHGEDPGLLKTQGHIAILRGAYEEALTPLETAARRLDEAAEGEARDDHAVADVHLWLGEALRRVGRNAEARRHLECALALRPDSGWLLGTMGQVQRASGDGDAERTLRDAVEADDSPSFAHVELGELLREEGRLTESREVLSRGTDRWPDDAWLWGSLGATEYLLKDYDAALASCDKALSRNSAYAWAWGVKGSVLMDTDELDRAVGAFDAALDLEPSPGWPWMLRGWTLELLERREDARRSFQHAVDREADTWGLIGLADLQLQDGDAEEARRRFEDVLQLLPGINAAELSQKGWCHLRLDLCEKAAREFGRALLLEEPFSPVQFDLALALLGMEPVERAIDAYAEAVVAVRGVAHAGRRRFLLHVAEHDLEVVRAQPSFQKVNPDYLDVIRWMLERDGPAAPEWREDVEGNLVPNTYPCTLHGTDLTDKVIERLSTDPVQVVNFGYSVRRRGDKRKDKPFTVVVRCPGSGSGDDAHDHEFKGVVAS
ncbi:tetratricopeptide repeat protein [Streptomyces lunaelactis]|uniref:tetratricopeptide repeat protein n=1 Tax=Streptomyces lunaelactis TaxID=1535768 RepID=UPI00158449D0|nr:tetratricopeptide repeat protein [Streptomyces lunaelactis]NUK01526.1 tetratricopeptide repeat protein [Streptomyces lunaelactis]NUK20339.1 tetratricopeptide repeat protein [Streptomyces lunaelactis]